MRLICSSYSVVIKQFSHFAFTYVAVNDCTSEITVDVLDKVVCVKDLPRAAVCHTPDLTEPIDGGGTAKLIH